MTLPDEEEGDVVGGNLPAKRPRLMEVEVPPESLKQLSEEVCNDPTERHFPKVSRDEPAAKRTQTAECAAEMSKDRPIKNTCDHECSDLLSQLNKYVYVPTDP